MKITYITVTALAVLAFVPATQALASPSAIPGQACDVNWVGGACGKSGPLSEAGTGGFPTPECNRHDPCDCKEEKPARS